MSTTTPFSQLAPVEQMKRLLDAAEGTCINPKLVSRFLGRVSDQNILTSTPGTAAALFEQTVRSLGKTAGYGNQEIDEFLVKAGVIQPKPKVRKATITMTFDVEVESDNPAWLYEDKGDGGIVMAAEGKLGALKNRHEGVRATSVRYRNYTVKVHD